MGHIAHLICFTSTVSRISKTLYLNSIAQITLGYLKFYYFLLFFFLYIICSFFQQFLFNDQTAKLCLYNMYFSCGVHFCLFVLQHKGGIYEVSYIMIQAPSSSVDYI